MATSTQMNRNYELVVGDLRTGEGVTITPPMGISFSITKSSSNVKKHDSGEIEIYNLPDSAIKLLAGDYPAAILRVGYANQPLITILIGEVISASTKKQGAVKVTQLQIGSSYVELNHTTVEELVPEGKSVRQVLEVLQKATSDITKGVFSGKNIEQKVLYGYPINGTVRETLNSLCNTYHLEYHIDNKVLYVHDADGTIDENYTEAPLINESSGLIEIPYDTKVDLGKAKKSVDNKGGVHFKVLLNPTLQAGSIVRVESREITGWFKISDIHHYGGNRTTDWYSDCKCVDKRKVINV